MSTPEEPRPTKVFKILTNEQWAAWDAEGTFSGAGIDINDGYIHLSTDKQVVETYDKFFTGAPDLVLVVVDLTKITDEIKWEPSRKGQLFPHVYGSIDKSAVVSTVQGWGGAAPQV